MGNNPSSKSYTYINTMRNTKWKQGNLRERAHMRWQYSHLNETPYLYPSKELRNMHRSSKGKKEMNAIVNHMERHEVFNNREYKGYYHLSSEIIDDLYEDGDEVLEWGCH